jgi:WD40 repeat protein
VSENIITFEEEARVSQKTSGRKEKAEDRGPERGESIGVLDKKTDSSVSPLWSHETGGLVRGVSVSADGSHVAAGSNGGRVYLFDRSGLLWSHQTGGAVWGVSVSADGKYMAAGSADGKVYFFQNPILKEIEEKKRIERIKTELIGEIEELLRIMGRERR